MKRFFRVLSSACIFLMSFTVQAADYPTKPIRMVVVYQPGGANDILARVIGARMAESLGQPVIIENKPGASGMIGAKYVATSAPDGYTLLVGGAPLVVSPALFNSPSVDPLKDFVPIGNMVDLPIILVAHKHFAANTPRELVALAKAKPGTVTMAVTAPTYMFYTERMNSEAGISLLRVPYPGVAGAMNDVPSGRVDLLIDTVAAQLPHLNVGRTKAIAVFTATRQPALPNVPTLDESGFKGFADAPFIGLLAPSDTPDAIVTRLNTAMTSALAQEDVKKKLDDMGFIVAPSPPDVLAKRMRTDIERYKVIGLKANIAKE
jgi:tripartite-type tricarboxylate transporter receptor subunit TctC